MPHDVAASDRSPSPRTPGSQHVVSCPAPTQWRSTLSDSWSCSSTNVTVVPGMTTMRTSVGSPSWGSIGTEGAAQPRVLSSVAIQKVTATHKLPSRCSRTAHSESVNVAEGHRQAVRRPGDSAAIAWRRSDSILRNASSPRARCAAVSLRSNQESTNLSTACWSPARHACVAVLPPSSS